MRSLGSIWMTPGRRRMAGRGSASCKRSSTGRGVGTRVDPRKGRAQKKIVGYVRSDLETGNASVRCALLIVALRPRGVGARDIHGQSKHDMKPIPHPTLGEGARPGPNARAEGSASAGGKPGCPEGRKRKTRQGNGGGPQGPLWDAVPVHGRAVTRVGGERVVGHRGVGRRASVTPCKSRKPALHKRMRTKDARTGLCTRTRSHVAKI